MNGLEAAGSKIKRYLLSYNFLGFVLGMVFVYASFTPSLLPRGWVLQSVLSAVLFSIGYGFGVIISFFIRKFKPKEPSLIKKNQIKGYAYCLLLVGYFIALIAGVQWQKEVKELIGQTPESNWLIIGILILTDLLIAFILLIARSIRTLFHWLKALIGRVIPRPVAYVAGFVITIFLVIGFINGFLLSGIYNIVNQGFSIRNDKTDEGIVQPSQPQFSGSNESLIPWETLGRQGRNFIGMANTIEEITEFNQAPAEQPIRIYSGLKSADTAEQRAQLALDDLKRAGGFEKEIILVVTTTGTGWVDESGVEALEYMYNGDSAIVAMQYSYLPSWLSFLVDQEKAREAGSELYDTVYGEWLSLPVEDRPKIVVFGESLGSFGSETAFASQSAFRSTSDGAVWVGPPNFNTLWRKAVAGRDEGSPEILPVVENGKTVRFAARPNDLIWPETTWENPHAVYLQNPSDPIVWWTPKLLLNKPDWLNEAPGADVSDSIIWLPFISFFQVSGDMVFSTAVPDGHGHKYGDLPTDAWAQVAPSDGWTSEKTEALKAFLRQ